MTPRPHSARLTLACALAYVVAGGCAGLPRIDPSGERLLIWPKDQPRVASNVLVAPSSSVVAPPVVTDPFFPQPAVAATPAAAITPGVTPAAVALAKVPTDKVTITPERVLAPVGSEVVLKAAVCTTEGYTLADQKVEWMLGRNGVGQFVEVSGKGLCHPPLLPWNKSKKVDNYLAEGWTANSPMCINRGTPDPADDVNVLRGDAWISVTSPNEGTSYVTAYMPTVDSWDTRRTSATIYWVDVQWTFPPATVGGGGRSATLTTLVTRQSNGTPIEGWLVRYELADGGGALSGGASGQVVEVSTDANGRASVDAMPTASGAASTPVNIQLIRPAGFGGGDAPRLIVGTGASVIQWNSGSTQYLPPVSTNPTPSLPTSPAPTTPAPALPSTGSWVPPSTSGGTTSPPASVPNIPVAQPQLQVTLDGDPQVQVGGVATTNIVVRNIGTGVATQVQVVDRIDRGLMNRGYPDQREVPIKPDIPSLAPGTAQGLKVTYDVVAEGQLCHDVTVTSAEGATDTARHCHAATPQRALPAGGVRVRKETNPSHTVGDVAVFRITVENTGELPLVGIRVVDEYPQQFFTVLPPTESISDGRNSVVTHQLDRLEPGQKHPFTVRATCRQAARPVIPMPTAKVLALTDPPTTPLESAGFVEDLEIRLRQPGAGGDTGVGGPLGAAVAPIKPDVAFMQRPAIINSRTSFRVTLVNSSQIADEGVGLTVTMPSQLVPDVRGVGPPPNVQAQLVGAQQLQFTPVAMLRPGERVTYDIPVTVQGPPGFAEVVTTVVSRNMGQSASRTDNLEISSR
jgi:uncharacterized repeat protein (TIGR01451 family)